MENALKKLLIGLTLLACMSVSAEEIYCEITALELKNTQREEYKPNYPEVGALFEIENNDSDITYSFMMDKQVVPEATGKWDSCIVKRNKGIVTKIECNHQDGENLEKTKIIFDINGKNSRFTQISDITESIEKGYYPVVNPLTGEANLMKYEENLSAECSTN